MLPVLATSAILNETDYRYKYFKMEELHFEPLKLELMKKCYENYPKWNNLYGYLKINGDNVLTLKPIWDFCKNIDAVQKQVQICSEDTLVIGNMRTGTTWTREIVWHLGNNMDYEKSKELEVLKRCPNLEIPGYSNLLLAEDKVVNNDFINYIDFLAGLPHPGFFHSHLMFDVLPSSIKNGSITPKIIYVLRNPKDACISLYHFRKKSGVYTGNFEDFCYLMMDGYGTIFPFWKHFKSYWNNRDKLNILFIKYEDMTSDLKSVLVKISQFMGKNYTDDELKKLSEHMEFEKMKENGMFSFKKAPILKKLDGQFLRDGRAGQFREMMSEKLIEDFDKWTESNLENTGFE